MFSLTVCFGPTNMVWAFLFKDKKTADQAWATATMAATPFHIIDDFGQMAHFTDGSIHGVCFEDLEQSEEARILRSLANARGEVKARQRAQTDPVIRQAQQGPAVLQPMGNRFNG